MRPKTSVLTRQHLTRFLTGDVSLLVLSSGAAQVVNLGAYPFLTQYYSPASFGAFSVVTAVATFAGAAVLLRFDTIIQIVEESEEDNILVAAVVSGLGLSMATTALLLMFGEWLFSMVAEGQDWQAGYAVVIPLLALMNGLFALSRQYSAKKLRYRRFSIANFLRTLTTVLAQLGLVVVLPGPTGLIAGFALGLVFALALAWPLPVKVLTLALSMPRKALRNAWTTINRHRGFIRVDVVNVLLAASVLSIYPVVVLIVFGNEQAGFFAVASRLVLIPVTVLAASISTVFYQRFSLAVRQGEGMMRLFGVTIFGAIIIAAVITLTVLIAAEPFVRIFFPPEWAPVSWTMLLLLPTFVVRFIVGCVGNTPLALNRPRILFAWNVVQIAIIGSALLATFGENLDLFLLASGGGLLMAGTIYMALLSIAIRRTLD